MEIALHIGPHKTGTTSIQKTLLELYGADEPTEAIWYPAPVKNGPGHAQLKNDSAGLREVVDVAAAKGVRTLLLSSENFSLCYSNRFEEQRKAFGLHDVHLVSTMSPILRRSISYWQEMKKHGDITPLEQVCDLVLPHAGFQPDLIDVAGAALSAKRISVVLTDPMHAPEMLINNFFDALGIDAHVIDAEKINTSIGLIEALTLHGFNKAWKDYSPKGKQYHEVRDLLLRTFRSGEWQTFCPQISIPLSDAAEAVLLERERQTMDRIVELRNAGKLQLVGSWDFDL